MKAIRDLKLKTLVYQAMFDSSQESKLKGAGLLHYLAPKATNLISVYFQRWRDFQADSIQHERADIFYKQRGAKYILKQSFDKLVVNIESQKRKDTKLKVYSSIRQT
jgi:hypothetical protein